MNIYVKSNGSAESSGGDSPKFPAVFQSNDKKWKELAVIFHDMQSATDNQSVLEFLRNVERRAHKFACHTGSD